MTAPSFIGPQVRIRDLRKAHGLTIPALVQRIRTFGVTVHKDTISNVELGYRRASDELLTAWAKALGINPLDVCQPPADQDAYSGVDREAGAA
ncbi:helix-turn-helix domain-containing protein [Nonomuraea pusilla]|uniref:Helix-turn-helix domain-containing protein n=1 Tax=Nonomuraea pusilla TaxID=46177 RepID=A0A1H7YWM8_9ACTN|nr:helix-turn-helix transcriptional regulator [Nonomuraea pusilla]SEM49768.1 Helix-turn-helix domain-containing protein [Nonomuraea pusilla]